MNTAIEDKKISDITVRELKELIRDTVLEIIDPDYGLELRSEVEESLKESTQDKEAGKGITLDAAKKELGIE